MYRRMKSWLKGGLIGAGIFLLWLGLFPAFKILAKSSDIYCYGNYIRSPGKGCEPPPFFRNFFLKAQGVIRYPLFFSFIDGPPGYELVVFFAIVAIGYFLMGVLIGFIIGKIKHRR